MKRSMVFIVAMFMSHRVHAKYLQNIFQDPTHPQVSVGETFTPKFKPSGLCTEAAVVYHQADPNETIIPKVLLDIGVKPESWALNIGVGGDRGNYFVPFGASMNLTPSVLGPLLLPMKASSNKSLNLVANLIDSPNGGVAFGPSWTAYPLVNGTVLPLNRWRFPPGWFVGGLWRFGGVAK